MVTSECSAIAVDLAAPQVPRSAIEYDRSTSSATARAGAPLGLDHLEVLDGDASPAPALGPRAARGAQHGVPDRADDVQRLLVAEPPLPRARR